jgi:hypothetical protein
MRGDTETHCHCGCPYAGSDHCPDCGCEQFESGDCGHTYGKDVGNMNQEEAAANTLDKMRAEHARACRDLHAARIALRLAERDERIARLRYDRQALWIRADELRKELARVENEAAAIRVSS